MQSQIGAGTTVAISLPIYPEPAAEGAAPGAAE
jgi:hypothetical protein